MTIFRGIVTATAQLSRDLVRITLGGPGVAGYLSTGVPDEYVRVFFPHGDDPLDVSLPVPDGDWWATPPGAPEAPMRTYTISAVREPVGEIDIDFVTHAAGVAGPWALAARPGHVLGLNAPTGLYEPPAGTRWQLLAADLTGLPAAARIAARRGEIRTRLVLEIPAGSAPIDLAHYGVTGVDVTWVEGGNGRGPSALGEIVRRALHGQRALDEGYVWVAGETAALRDARKLLRRELGLPATHFKVVGYWNPVADWSSRYDALPEDVQRELAAIWDAPAETEAEDTQLRYEERLAQLGL
ncbi:siderophore-interacting protein [Leucobacter chromiireducens]|uniref:siderophore-interacting protein n=1 Tax=Leucobacter chromiireducens TaxID=283877 RepID=UPI000F6320A0|nr:siderophore-interacting protein [Leucobacter chromiireducens]